MKNTKKTTLTTEFTTKSGDKGNIITRIRKDGLYVTTFLPPLGLNFHSIDQDRNESHETVKNFLRDVKGCMIDGDTEPYVRPTNKKRFIL